MKGSTQGAPSSPGKDMYDHFNNAPNQRHGSVIGNKHQTTVRFDTEVFRKIQDIKDIHDCSLAEAIRRSVREGMSKIKDRQGFIIDVLNNLKEDSEKEEMQKAVEEVKEAVYKSDLADAVDLQRTDSELVK